MPNAPVRAAAEGMPTVNRRAAMLGAGATMAALAASTRSAPAASSSLQDLIAAHRRAHGDFLQAIEVYEAKDRGYIDAFLVPDKKDVTVPLSIGGEVSFRRSHFYRGEEVAKCRRAICRAYDAARTGLRPLVGPLGVNSVHDLNGSLRKAEAADLRAMRKLVAEDVAREEAFGLLATDRAREAASEAEASAARALLAFHCVTREEVRMRAEYLTAGESGGGNIIWDGIGNDWGNRLLRALLFASLEDEGVEA